MGGKHLLVFCLGHSLWEAVFLLAIRSFLLTMELFYSQLCLGPTRQTSFSQSGIKLCAAFPWENAQNDSHKLFAGSWRWVANIYWCFVWVIPYRKQFFCLQLEASCLQWSSFTHSRVWELVCLQLELFNLQFSLFTYT